MRHQPSRYTGKLLVSTGLSVQKAGRQTLNQRDLVGKLKLKKVTQENGASTPVSAVADLVTAMIGSVGAAAVPIHGATAPQLLQNAGILTPSANEFRNTQTVVAGRPKAYLNWILLDDQFKLVNASSSFDAVGADNTLKIHTKNELPITKNGYFYVYVSNETPNIDVFFDNLQVNHKSGAILEEMERSGIRSCPKQ